MKKHIMTALRQTASGSVILQEPTFSNNLAPIMTLEQEGMSLEKKIHKPKHRFRLMNTSSIFLRDMVRFSLKNANHPISTVRMRLTVNGVRMSHALPADYKVAPRHWDPKTGRVITSIKDNPDLKGNPQLRILLENVNREIEKTTTAVVSVIARFQQQGVRPSGAQIRSELHRELGWKEVEAPRSFSDFFEFVDFYVNACREGKILTTKGTRLISGTISSYMSTRSILKRYAADRRMRLTLEDITMEFYSDFINYLNHATHSRGRYKPNAIGKFVKNIRVFMRYAYENKYTLNDDFKRRDFRVFQEQAETVYLNEAELKALHDLQLPANQAEVRDAFLIGCWTGLRFSDIVRLEKKHINMQAGMISILTKKTATPVVIPIHPVVREILNRYGGCPPSVQCNQAMNRMLKRLCRQAGITVQIMVSEVLGGERQTRWVEKCEMVSTHTARRSFATNAFKAGIPSDLIMSVTGHKTETNFRRYIRCSAEEKAAALQDYKFFN